MFCHDHDEDATTPDFFIDEDALDNICEGVDDGVGEVEVVSLSEGQEEIVMWCPNEDDHEECVEEHASASAVHYQTMRGIASSATGVLWANIIVSAVFLILIILVILCCNGACSCGSCCGKKGDEYKPVNQ